VKSVFKCFIVLSLIWIIISFGIIFIAGEYGKLNWMLLNYPLSLVNMRVLSVNRNSFLHIFIVTFINSLFYSSVIITIKIFIIQRIIKR